MSYYELTKEKVRSAYERYNAASSLLENARIMERLAEIKEQHEPLANLLEKQMTERERLYAAAFYVVCGRMPE